MDSVEGEKEKEWLLAVAVDERQRFTGKGPRQVFRLVDRIATAADGIDPIFNTSGRKVGMRSAEKAEGFLEATALGKKRLGMAEMPLPDQPRAVASRAEQFRECPFGEGEPDLDVRRRRRAGIELVAESLLVAAGEQPGAGRAAVRARHIARRAAHARGGESVEPRRGDVTPSLEARVGVAEIVGHDDENVGPPRRPGRQGRGERDGNGGQKDQGQEPEGEHWGIPGERVGIG